MSINTVAISGKLTRNAELRTTQGGMEILGFSVAVNDRRKNAAGEWEDRPNFIDCTMFGKRAAAIEPYMAKGSKVAVLGKLRWSQWEKDGEKRSKVEVVVDEVEFMSGRRESTDAAPAAAPAASADPYDEDIPF